MLRSTIDRLHQCAKIVRPQKPHDHAHPDHVHHGRHYDVHLACGWLHELTDAPIEHLHREFATHQKKRTKMSPQRLHEVAVELMAALYAHDQHFSAENYAALYHHIQQGMIPEGTP